MTDAPRDEEPVAGMATGSDAGAPGEHLPEPPLTEDEQRLLEAFERPAEGEPIEALEDSPEAAEAADDDAPLAGLAGRDEGDPDSARFQAPPAQ
jgi:hypothetical protein